MILTGAIERLRLCATVWDSLHQVYGILHIRGKLYIIIGASSFSNAHFGEGEGPILIGRVYCSSPYNSLLDCSIYYRYNVYYTHNDDVGVRCQCKYTVEPLYNGQHVGPSISKRCLSFIESLLEWRFHCTLSFRFFVIYDSFFQLFVRVVMSELQIHLIH